MPANDMSLALNGSIAGKRTFDTASRGPLTFRMRSGLPGMLSDTMTRAPLFSLISLTCEPPLPMMIEASWVTIKHRICMLAAGCAPDVDWDVLGAAEVVAEDSPVGSVPEGASPLPVADAFSADGDGVDAAVSSTDCGASMRADAETETDESFVRESSDVAPVLARLCLGWSASEGERDRLRVASASGMVSIQFLKVPGREGLSVRERVWEGCVGVCGWAWALEWGSVDGEVGDARG